MAKKDSYCQNKQMDLGLAKFTISNDSMQGNMWTFFQCVVKYFSLEYSKK